MGNKISFLTAAVVSLWSVGAAAHVVTMPRTAEAGRPVALAFWVPEGCTGEATTALSIDIPEGIVFAKPQPKAGWTVQLDHAPLADPIINEGVVQKERVTRITWSGGPAIPDSQFEQFTVLLRLPATAGPLRFPAVQTCAVGEKRWVEIPSAANAQTGLRYPAPTLTVTEPR